MEFALVVSLLVVLVTGVIDIGRALYAQVGLQDAVQEGTLYGSYQPDDYNAIRERAMDGADWPPLAPADITVSCPSGGGSIEVSATHDLDLITPLAAWWGDGTITLRSENLGQIYSEEPCDASP